MLGELDNNAIEHLLQDQWVGRIGCQQDGEVYVVPVTYAYEGNNIYGHSGNGRKIEAMRTNPAVCFQVDNTQSMNEWQSVIAWGLFEELKNEDERRHAMHLLINRLQTLIDSNRVQGQQPVHNGRHGAGLEPIFFRIKISNKTGRFERPDADKPEVAR